MAQQADGTVYINSSIDTDGVETGGKRLGSAFKRVANTAKTAVGSIRSGMQSINQAMSTNLDTSGFDTMQDKIDTLSEHLKSLEAQGISFGYEEYDKTYQQLVLAEDELKQYKATLAETARAEQDSAQSVGLLQSILNALAGAAHAPISVLQLLGTAIKQLPHAALNLFANGLRKIADAAKNAAKRIGSGLVTGLKKAGAAMLSFHKNTKKSNGSLSSGIKNILKYTLGIGSLVAVFRKIRSAAKEGMKNLAQFSSETNKNLSALMSSLTRLKNSLATAFNPILSVVTPILTKFIDMLSQAATYVGMLFAALTGKNSFTKAVAVQEDYAASLGDTADNAKKALKYLSGLDEVRTFTEEQEDSHGYQGPTPQDMFENVQIPDKIKDLAKWLKDMWANADFYDLGKLLGEKLKEALDNIPWDKIKETARKIGKSIASFINGFIEVEGLGYSIGKTLVEAINTGFEFLNAFVHELHWESVGKFIAETINGFFENIDWPLIYDTFITGAKGLGDAINSFVDNLNWDAISTSISNFVNTFVDSVYTFFTTVDWKKLGKKIGRFISDLLEKIDWKKVGETLGVVAESIFDLINSVLEEIDWELLADSVWDLLSNVDWGGLFGRLGLLLLELFRAEFTFGNKLGQNITSSLAEFFRSIGWDSVAGFFEGLSESIKNYGDRVKASFQVVIDWAKEKLGIHSPSTVFAEIGRNIIQGLIEGIQSLIESVALIWESMKQTAIAAWSITKETIVNIWQTIKQTAESVFNGIQQFFVDTWNNISANAQNIWSNLKENAVNIFTSIKDFLFNTWSSIKEKTSQIWSETKENISNAIENIKEKITNVVNSAKDTWSNGWDQMKDKVSSIIDSVKNIIQSAFDWIAEKVNSMTEKLSSVGSKAKSIFSGGSLFSGGLFGSKSTKYSAFPDLPIVPALPNINIPYLATGAVIPPNAPFAAILGDQKNGKNLELPENLLRKIVREESGNNNGVKEIRIPISLSGRQIFEAIITEAQLQQMMNGRNPFEMA